MKYKYRLDKVYNRLIVWLRSLFWNKKKSVCLSWEAADSIAVIFPHGLGDIIMATAFFRKLRALAPQAKITYIGSFVGRLILEEQNLIDQYIVFPSYNAMHGWNAILKHWREVYHVLKQARNKKFDIVIEPFGNTISTLFASFLRANQYVGLEFSNLYKLQTFTVPYQSREHIIDVMMYIFQYTGCKFEFGESCPKIFLSHQQLLEGKEFINANQLNDKLKIGIHPGASVSSRRWKGFVRLIGLLCQNQPDTVICLFCGPGDENFVQNILNHVDEKFKGRVLLVKRSLLEYIAILSTCSHVICNDSSCGHISAALGVPVTVLFAQGDPRFIAPRGANTINIISRDFSCKPCLQNKCPKKTNECFTWITPEIVFDTIKNMLN